MANDPVFASTILLGATIAPGTLDTSMTAPTNVATVVTAGASGSKIEQLRLTQLVTTSGTCEVNVFLYDGATYHFWDFFTVATGTVSTTANIAPVDKFYTNLWLPNGWSLRYTVTVATGQSAFKLFAMAGSY